jgi:DNA-binding response OmpR family regulator
VAEALQRSRTVSKRVLIVEDEPVLRRQLVRHFETLGAAVDSAAEPEEGGALIASRRYDGAILDLCLTRLGGADGLALLQEFRERDSEAIVVVLSANVTEEARRQALASGATRVLQKPQSLDDLACLVLGGDAVAEPWSSLRRGGSSDAA